MYLKIFYIITSLIKVLWFKSFSNSLLLSIFLLVAIFHLRLGLTVVIEDYIHNLKRKKILLSFLEILYLFLAVFTVIIILMLYIWVIMFKKAYNIIEHNYDVIVVGAGGAGTKSNLGSCRE